MKSIPGISISQLKMNNTTIIKAEPGNYVLSLNDIENGQFVLSKHPVVAFHILPYYSEGRYETRPITVIGGPVFVKPTLLTPDGVVYEENCAPCDLETYIKCLSARHGDKLEFHVSMDRL